MEVMKKFQFAPLREGRRWTRTAWTRPIYFNSRPCVKGDKEQRKFQKQQDNFNSRPCVKGDGRRGELFHGLHQISIRAPA